MADDLERSEAEALLAARRELGSTYERELAESFADRIERVVDERVDDRLRRRGDTPARGADRGGGARQLALGIVSVVAGIPITVAPAIAAGGEALPFVGLAWLGIVGINAAHASSVNGPRRSRRPDDDRGRY